MPTRNKGRVQNLGILLVLATGIALLLFPISTEEILPGAYTAQKVVTSELDVSIGYAPPGYFVDAHITASNQVTVTLTLVGTSTVLLTEVFPAGTFDTPRVIILNGGNVFLTIEPQNKVFTQMTVYARIFHEVVTYPYSWMGVAILGVAGIFAFAIFLPNTTLGRAARMIVPVK